MLKTKVHLNFKYLEKIFSYGAAEKLADEPPFMHPCDAWTRAQFGRAAGSEA